MPNTASIAPTSNNAETEALDNSVDVRVFRVHSDYYYLQPEMTLQENKEAGE